MSKLDEILKLPFEEYMAACWNHMREKALADPIAEIVYLQTISEPAAMESMWARRYWFSKVEELK